ncbi:MAG: restriction endonuclease subunit S [Gemmataceae bacterium]
MSEIVLERSDLRRFSVLPDDVLMNEGGDRDKLGRGCVWSGEFTPCVHQNHVFVVRCTKQLYARYLTAWTQTPVAKHYFINAGSQTTNLASINKTALGQLPVLLPPTLAEQEAIAGALSDADAEIAALEAKLAKARQVKQGMMQELLTGRTRLV